MPDPSNEPDLSWLADSPMFIDSQQIGAFYDAVVGPAFRTVELQISAERTGQVETSVTARLGAKLTALFPWLRVDADAEGHRTTTKGRQEGENIVLQPVESATRQLVELSLHYLVNQHDRIRLAGNGPGLPDRDAIGASPRMIAFVDACAGSRFPPQAAELNDGRVVTFFDPLIEKLKHDGRVLPVAYPDETTTNEGRLQHDTYWDWFSDHWNADKAVKVVEAVIGDGGRPRWVDYRARLHTDGARAPAVTWQLGKRGMDRSPRLPWGTPRKRTIWTPPLDRHRGLGSRSPGGWSTCSRMRVPSKTGSGPSCSSQAARWSFACTRFAHRQPFGYRLADAEPVPELGACAAWGRSPWPDSIWLRRSQASARWTRSA